MKNRKEIIYECIRNTDICGDAPKNEPERQYYYIAKCAKWLKNEEKRLGRKLTYYTKTFGCQMNFKDSEKLNGVLEAIGYSESENENADLVIYNTCTVRENANSRVYGRIGYLGKLKKKNPEMRIAMCGCMMQEAHVVERLKKSYRFVDIIFGTHNIYMLAELLYRDIENSLAAEKNIMTIDIWEGTDKIVEELPSELKYSFKAGVNIMFGCNNFCSYCIVPYVRGRERSRKPEDIIDEIKELVERGVVEIMLLGQNVNSYGKGLEEEITFAQLLLRIEQIEGLKRIRFMTSHPKDLSDELIEVMAASKKICRHLHLPVQSGSTAILKKMNRKYSKEDYLKLVNKIREKIPDIALTTDIIVGFPGESEEDFCETLDLCNTIKYDSAYTFLYSKRSGTPAAQMPDQVPEDVAKERFNRLLEVINEGSEFRANINTGKTVEVLVEEKEENSDFLTGRMDNNMLVHFKGDETLIGRLVNVSLDECKGFYYFGRISDIRQN